LASLRILALPSLFCLAALAVSLRYVRLALRRERQGERDPLGPSEDVASALERAQAMKISTEAEALAYVGGR
jgi:hypothetical protein